MNAREQLHEASEWLSWQNESLSEGLRSAEDGLKLWAYFTARPELPEFADGSGCTAEEENYTIAECKRAIGYDPLNREYY